MEYLLSHTWMILIIVVVLAVLYFLGVFNPGTFATDTCNLPAGFTCRVLGFTPAGVLTVSVIQSTASPINIAAIGCTSNQTTLHMLQLGSQHLNTGSNTTLSVQCYAGSTFYNGTAGSVYRGFVELNYTDISSGFPHTVTGSLTAKIK